MGKIAQVLSGLTRALSGGLLLQKPRGWQGTSAGPYPLPVTLIRAPCGWWGAKNKAECEKTLQHIVCLSYLTQLFISTSKVLQTLIAELCWSSLLSGHDIQSTDYQHTTEKWHSWLFLPHSMSDFCTWSRKKGRELCLAINSFILSELLA